MMDRRDFLRRCALIAAGVVAADQLDLLEMLAPRRLFPGAAFETSTTVTTLADLYRKTNTEVAMALRHMTEEYKWFQQYPAVVKASGNENRIPLRIFA
jgi:hypothetical protein